MGREEFYNTVPVCKMGSSLIIGLNGKWGLDVGDWINIEIWPVDDPETKIVATKKVSRRGNGIGVYCNQKWGFRRDDLVSYRIVRADDHTGSGTENKAP